MSFDIGFYLIDHRLIALAMIALLVAAGEIGFRRGIRKRDSQESFRSLMSGTGAALSAAVCGGGGFHGISRLGLWRSQPGRAQGDRGAGASHRGRSAADYGREPPAARQDRNRNRKPGTGPRNYVGATRGCLFRNRNDEEQTVNHKGRENIQEHSKKKQKPNQKGRENNG